MAVGGDGGSAAQSAGGTSVTAAGLGLLQSVTLTSQAHMIAHSSYAAKLRGEREGERAGGGGREMRVLRHLYW
jgi:hypothetical protein